jgi:hypothetical protein
MVATSTAVGADPGIARARKISNVLDKAYLDPVLGLLVPGVGDLVSSLFGLYVVGIAIDRRLPMVVVARMLINLGLDATIGAIPLAGDLFDFAFKAHTRNLELLEQRHGLVRARASDWAYVAGAALALVAAIAVPIYLIVMLVSWLA